MNITSDTFDPTNKYSLTVYHFEEGEDVQLICSSLGSQQNPPPQFKMFWNDESGGEISSSYEKRSITNRKTKAKLYYDYKILKLSKASKITEGTYTCNRKIKPCSADQSTSASIVLKYIGEFAPKRHKDLFKIPMFRILNFDHFKDFLNKH